MKDPAFLFYSQDFFVGTATMSFEDKGKYITLLCLMHQQGRMSEETIRLLVGSPSVTLKSKFDVDENGLWFNERLEIEAEKRVKFTESRRSNGALGGRPKANGYPIGLATENLPENENIIHNKKVFKEKKEKEKTTKVQIEKFNPLYHIPEKWNWDLFMVDWDDFMQMRKKKKWSCSENVLIKRLNQLRELSGDDWGIASAIMQKSSERGYAEFFALSSKDSTKSQNGHDPRFSATFVKDKA